ncbi:MAG TPA: glycoside hydrolase family 43 protein [Phycisphaerae bacterium]|nr:glycoside hydrolase family 43 protein [Phycisphaerae bacterium]
MKHLLTLIALPLLLATTARAADTPAPQSKIETQKSKIDSPAGFLFITFKGEQSPLTEQIYFGLSQDGLHWSALNNSNPVLVSDVGEKGVRDPYLLRTQDNHFVIVATDLSINLNGDWNRATHAGSKSIVIWKSDDLVHWSKPDLVKVAPDDAGDTWAPEAIYDDAKNDYVVYWASTTGRDNYSKQRIWAARTTDFKTFSPPFIFVEKPTTLIDADIVRDGNGGGGAGNYYRFIKDEKFKAISMESAHHLDGPWANVSSFSLAKLRGYEGPACFQLKPATPTTPATWCLLLDFYSKGQGYKPFLTTNLPAGDFHPDNTIHFPFHFRHGSVLPLTPDEYTRVKSAYTPPTTPPQNP